MKTYKRMPTCPHCECELDEEQTWHGEYTVGEVYSGDGDVSVGLTCPNDDCGKKFNVICAHELRWMACDEDGDSL